MISFIILNTGDLVDTSKLLTFGYYLLNFIKYMKHIIINGIINIIKGQDVAAIEIKRPKYPNNYVILYKEYYGIFISKLFKSLLNLFIIVPYYVKSKNDIDVFIIPFIILSCIV